MVLSRAPEFLKIFKFRGSKAYNQRQLSLAVHFSLAEGGSDKGPVREEAPTQQLQLHPTKATTSTE